MLQHHPTPLFTWILAATAAVACGTNEPDPTDNLGHADTDDVEYGDEVDAFDEDSGPDGQEFSIESAAATQSRSNLEFEYFEIPFNGTCKHDDGAAMGTIELLVYADNIVRGMVHYSWLSDTYPLSTTIGRNGDFSVRQLTTVGSCAFVGEVDLETMTTAGTWTCGPGCAGTWPAVEQ